MTFMLHSSAFLDGMPIPHDFSGEGRDVSPALQWSDPVRDAAEFALICQDPDAPQDEPFVHWLLYKIPGDARVVTEGLAKLADPEPRYGYRQGKNSFGRAGYNGPLPPRAHGLHRYHFTLYALRQPLELAAGAGKKQLLAAMSGLVTETAELIGTYERPSQTLARRSPIDQEIRE